MLFPLSWIEDFVDLNLPLEELVKRLTLAGLEVEELKYVGIPMPEGGSGSSKAGAPGPHTKVTGINWDPEKIVVGEILEVMPHPNADRLVLCRLNDGDEEHVVLTGAPNLFPFKGSGPLQSSIKVAFAREGATLFDGYKSDGEFMTLKRTMIRGVESYSMACSEKELGISDDHEGIIFLDEDAPVGKPLVEYMGDVVLDIAITPNIARDANIIGVAREISALTESPLRYPDLELPWSGSPIKGKVELEIENPELNPRFVLGLIEGVKIEPSPYWLQRRLKLAGIRPINNIVDATNYSMLELGEPLHAFDYDVLVQRAGGKPPKIITRLAVQGENLQTLDGVDRELDDFTVLVTDTAGPLSIAGVMGGAESEVSPDTTNVLLEGAAWNFINIRRTIASQNLISEAAYRFSRGVHPAIAEKGVRGCIKLMHQLAGGEIAQGLVDTYPLPPHDPTVELSPGDVERWLGIELDLETMASILKKLEFTVEVSKESIRAHTPDHRLDIGEGQVGVADLLEEIARVYGYDRIPETQISDTIPPQYGNLELRREEMVRDILVQLGLQEVITYRLTSKEREARRFPPSAKPDDHPYIQLENPIVIDRDVMRHSLLASVLEVVEHNVRIRERIAFFEIAPIFLVSEGDSLPDEKLQLVLTLTGSREPASWTGSDVSPVDFFDLKGVVENLFSGLNLRGVQFEPWQHPSYHPGKCARLTFGKLHIGVMGEVHPEVMQRYEFLDLPVLAAEIDLDALLPMMSDISEIASISSYPPVLEDLAIVVDEEISAQSVEKVIRIAGGDLLTGVRLFDHYQGEQIQSGKKSLAYALTYQAADRTLTDEEVAQIRARILKQLGTELEAKLRE